MKNINQLAEKVLQSYTEYKETGDSKNLAKWGALYMREFIAGMYRDEDIASEMYLKVQGKMDDLIGKFYSLSPEKILPFLKVCAKNFVRNLNKKSQKENQIWEYLVYTKEIENSEIVQEPILVTEQERENTSMLKAIWDAEFPMNCIFILKHDLPMVQKAENQLRSYLIHRGIFYGNFMLHHMVKKEEFSTKRAGILGELDRLTFKIVNRSKENQVSHWRQKKELKLKRLDNLLNHGLYSVKELADFFQIDHFVLRRKMMILKTKWGKNSYPKGDFSLSKAA